MLATFSLTITPFVLTIAPTAEVDAFWHAHILDTRKYFQDCATIANRYLHHFPYLGMLGEDDKLNLEKAGRERLRLLNSEFDLDSEICMELESVCSGDAGCKSCKSCGSQGVENLGVVRARPRPARPIPDTNRTMLH